MPPTHPHACTWSFPSLGARARTLNPKPYTHTHTHTLIHTFHLPNPALKRFGCRQCRAGDKQEQQQAAHRLPSHSEVLSVQEASRRSFSRSSSGLAPVTPQASGAVPPQSGSPTAKGPRKGTVIADSEQPFEDLQLGPLLGQGSFGKVYRGMWSGAPVAVKVILHIARLALMSRSIPGPGQLQQVHRV